MSDTAQVTLAQLEQSVCATLEQLAFAEALPCKPPEAGAPELLSTRLAFTGPLAGALTLRIPEPLARELAGDVLGDPDAAADPAAVRDAVGEFLNTIAGTLLRDAGLEGYELGLPEPAQAGGPPDREAWLEVRGQRLSLAFEPALPS